MPNGLLLRCQDPYRRWGGWLSLASLMALAAAWPWLRKRNYARLDTVSGRLN